jgi:4-amino-4-deoxy-L-arabinose transferase-like glycosyltransferase
LRYPIVFYTLLTAFMVFLLSWKLSGQLETGFEGFLIYLAFFSTYRYGRPFLTDPPQVFWLFLPFFVLLYWYRDSSGPGLGATVLFGIIIGIGLLYKSFALALPVLLALSWWYLHQRGYRASAFFAGDGWKIGMMGVISLAVFGLWFFLDPDPGAIWKEFVLGENVMKFDPKNRSYLSKFFWGGSSIWSQALGYPFNAGLLAFPVAAVGFVSYKIRPQLSKAEKLLWILACVFFVVFSLPSQRSTRYLLVAMPAIAVLCALNWQRISRKAFVASLASAGGVLAVIAYLSIRLQQAMPEAPPYSPAYWMLLTCTAAIILLAILLPKFTRPSVSIGVLLVFLCFTAFARPLDGPLGTFDMDAQRYVKDKVLWVPSNFRAKEEGYRFLLPEADVRAYPFQPDLSVADLSAKYPLFIIRLPMRSAQAISSSNIIGRRLDLSSRHTSYQIKEMLKGKVFEHLFVEELLVDPKNKSSAAP